MLGEADIFILGPLWCLFWFGMVFWLCKEVLEEIDDFG